MPGLGLGLGRMTRTIDGRPVHVCWVLMDRTAPMATNMLRGTLATWNRETVPHALLSENVRADGQRSLIKVVGVPGTRITTEAAGRSAVVRVFTPSDHHEAAALVSAEEWTPREAAS